MNYSSSFTGKLITIILLTLQASIFATNKLTVQDPNVFGEKNGYIDKATLVIEPFGSYVEQSLYLTYSDHAQFSPGSKLEIVHRFELPEGSVINDLWLWMGDSVMQGILMDTWRARSIYDSIVVVKRDPALLTKNGNQYEIDIYPLTPGGTRRIKINYITPTKWFGNQATAVIPFTFLNSNNNTVKPLEVFFRVSQNVWGDPALIEVPSAKFQQFKDTLGYDYKYFKIDDISNLPSLNLTFQTYFTDGYYFDGYRKKNDNTYFQLGILRSDFFNLQQDTTTHKYLIGLDLSGSHNNDLSQLIPNLSNVLKSSMRQNDMFNLIVAGAGQIIKYSDTWLPATPDNIDGLLNKFSTSLFADSLIKHSLIKIVYCDGDAANGWQFPGIDQFATTQTFPTIMAAMPFFSQANVIAAYRHGYEDPLTWDNIATLSAPLDSFFVRGGRLLTYYDFNRDATEKLASNYIAGLQTLSVTHGLVNLYRVLNGNIGMYFPESLQHESSYFLQYTEGSAKNDLIDDDGQPAVISKKIKNGLLVVSGIWELNDDGAMKTILDIPLLGLNTTSKYFQLLDLLNDIKSEYKSGSFDKVILFSNSDSLIQKDGAQGWVKSYLSDFPGNRPVFHSINLLDGINFVPPSITDGQTDYFGSGYLTKVLSDSTYGLHFETHTSDWVYIDSLLSPYSAPLTVSYSVSSGDTISGKIVDLREVDPVQNDPNKPLFFIGSSTTNTSLTFNVSARFIGDSFARTKRINFLVSLDTAQTTDVIPSMLGNEKLNDFFANATFDTSQIVSLALQYRLLCDYTAFIALEPNDTIHYMKNPNDEGSYTTGVKDKNNQTDSLSLDIYPNPFNNATSIIVSVPSASEVTLELYNILGQKVKEFANQGIIEGKKIYYWNGTNNYNRIVSSGIYFARAMVKEISTNKVTVKMKKMILLK